jgi:hypothetical protein
LKKRFLLYEEKKTNLRDEKQRAGRGGDWEWWSLGLEENMLFILVLEGGGDCVNCEVWMKLVC